MRTFILLSIISLISLVSCGEGGQPLYDQEMDQVEHLLQESKTPIQSVRLKLGQLKTEYDHFSENQKMRFELLDAEARNIACEDFTTDKEMKAVVRYFEKEGTAMQKMKACYLLGCVYRDMKETPLALKWMEKATQYTDTAWASKRMTARIYSQISGLYEECMMPQEEIETTLKGVNLFLQTKDSIRAYYLYGHLQHVYFITNQIDSAIQICKTASKFFRNAGITKEAAAYGGCNAYYHVLKKDFRNARRLLDECIRDSGRMLKGKAGDKAQTLYYIQGMCLLNEGKVQDAEDCFRKCLMESNGKQDKTDATNGLRDLYARKAIPDSVIKYADMAMHYHRLIYNESLRNSMLRTKASFDYDHNSFLVKSQESRLRQQRVYLYTLMVASGLFFLMAIAYFHERRKAKRAYAFTDGLWESAESYRKLAEQQTEKIDRLNEELRINDKATIKNNQLSSLKRTDFYSSLENQSNRVNAAMTEQEWASLYETLDNEMPLFLHTLRKAQLPQSKERLCILLKLNFSAHQIKNLLDNQKVNISAEKKRLLKKLAGLDGSPKDFDEYLEKL